MNSFSKFLLPKNFFSQAHFLLLALLLVVFCTTEVFSQSITPERDKFVTYSKKFIGTRYQSGATGPDAFDCSGFVYAMSRESVGVQLPRTSQAMYTFAILVPEADREIGDLVFFRTTSSNNISHVGILIDESTFIHCASDGPKTGVITSSLSEGYWKQHYVGTGRVLEPTKKKEINVNPRPNESNVATTQSAKSSTVSATREAVSTSKGSNGTSKTSYNSSNRKSYNNSSDFVADFSLCMDWSVLTAKDFILNFRGVSTQANIRYTPWSLEPGLGFIFRYDNKMGIVQLPILLSLTFSDYVRAYAGPVVTFGNAEVPGSSEEAKGSVFPGIIGLSFTTSGWQAGPVKIALMQDVQYTVFNSSDGSALSPRKSIASSLLLSSGVKVYLPL